MVNYDDGPSENPYDTLAVRDDVLSNCCGAEMSGEAFDMTSGDIYGRCSDCHEVAEFFLNGEDEDYEANL